MLGGRPWAVGLAIQAFLLVATLGERAFGEAGAGFVHVKSIPGVRVGLDGKHVGTTGADGSLILRDIPRGPHRIDASLDGHEDQVGIVMVEAGFVAIERLRPWQPRRARAGGTEAAPYGALVVKALPGPATIDAKRLGWRKIPIDEEPFLGASLPPGEHKMTFCNSEKCIDYLARIRPGDVTSVIIDFGPGVIYDVSADQRARFERWNRECDHDPGAEGCRRACALAAFAGIDLARACGRALSAGQMFVTAGSEMAGAPKGAVDVSAEASPPCASLAGGRTGVATIESNPEAEVYLGERMLGVTPLSRIELPAGCIELRLINRKRFVSKSVRIELDPESAGVFRFEL